ncbi:hypothetical protein STCU_05242 [Strigomonas culicis]|nr:hypothetical protein STCU_05242 [Strigomonas culicis]|eukprot:EPY28218.1 hypothetical protein STCU_05242 [Strigomonas culicis]
MFFMLMIAYCGGEGQLIKSLKRKRYRGMHPFPVCCLPSFALDTGFYLRCKRWVLQCALVKPFTSLIALVTNPFGIYKEGTFGLSNIYTYNCMIINFSLTWALYYLVLFEIECEKELHYAKTFLKFLCIKSIIFFSYWQSVVVSLMSSSGILYLGADSETQEEESAVIQDLLMCFELLPVAFLHRAAFGRDKLDEEMACVPMYMKEDGSGDFRSNIDTALDVNDIIDDTIGTIFYRQGKLIDQENADSDVEVEVPTVEGERTRSHDTGAGDMMARDPTLDELVRHAIITDYGVRVDGLLHYDEDSDREAHNAEMFFRDTDVILYRSKAQKASEDVRVDTELLQSNQTQMLGAPQIYCVVCGRFDREMVRRRNGYKCKECVGTKSQTVLRVRQQEDDTDEMAAAGHRPHRHRHGDTAVVIETLRDEGDFVQPLPETPDADLDGVIPPRNATGGDAASVLQEGFSNFNAMLRQTFMPESSAAAGGAGGRKDEARALPTCRSCGESKHMVSVGEGKWRCSHCTGERNS